jgi:4-diphosphocytidyl-2-C-methyl-D-erythritol kinase
MKVLKLKSPGKINVRLDVLNKRSDGFHDLRMINTAVSVFDDIEFELIERGIVVDCENDTNVPSGEGNIVYNVIKEILAYSNKNVGVHVRIHKNIPSSAGMGGGSSNAATVMLGLNELLKINLSKEKLMKIGVRFGADVPFFIYNAPAIATGIGENMTRIKKMPKLPLVLITPNIKVPTKWVFERYAMPGQEAERPHDEAIPVEFSTKKSLIRFLNNDLERVTIEKYPVVKELKAMLIKAGALAAQMTGSGPTVFGIFTDKEGAEKAGNRMRDKFPDFHVRVAENIG